MLKRCFLFLLVLSWNCLANDCSDFSLYSLPQSPLPKMEIYDQGKLNICYAMAASDLINFEIDKTGLKIHPLVIALEYAKHQSKKNLDIGVTREAIKLMETSHECSYEIIQRKIEELFGKNPYDKIYEISKSSSFNPLFIENLIFPKSSKCFKEKSKKLSIVVERLNFRVLADDNSYEFFLKQKLQELKKPISITYCSNIWRLNEYDGIDQNEKGIRDRLKKDCHYHESTVVGKKIINGQCHFLVKNSWGTNWTRDNERYLCTCRKKDTKEIIDNCNTHKNKDLEVLACWIPARGLARNIGALTIINSISRSSYPSHPLAQSM